MGQLNSIDTILNTQPLDPNPRTLSIITVGLGHIYQGAQVVPLNTQYSILYPWTLTLTLSIIITVGLGQRCCQIYQGAKVGPLNTQYSILYPWTLTPEP